MLALCVRTDNPQAELRLYKDDLLVAEKTWQAHRELAESLHVSLEEVLRQAGISQKDITRIVFYEGPGSFTGLRIGASLVNALAYSLNIPVVAVSGEDWQRKGMAMDSVTATGVVPEYGSAANITAPRK